MGSRIVKAVGRMLKSASSAVADASSLTKGEMKMKKMIIGLVMVMMLAAGSAFAATGDPLAVDLYVTPGSVTAELTIATTWYNFGTVDLAASTSPANAIITIENSGTGGITVTKQITSEFTGWTAEATDPAADTDKYRLYLGTSSVAVSADSWTAECVATTGALALTGAGGTTAVSIPATGADSVDIHAQLDMPGFTGVSTQKTAVVTFDATVD